MKLFEIRLYNLIKYNLEMMGLPKKDLCRATKGIINVGNHDLKRVVDHFQLYRILYEEEHRITVEEAHYSFEYIKMIVDDSWFYTNKQKGKFKKRFKDWYKQ